MSALLMSAGYTFSILIGIDPIIEVADLGVD